MIIDRYVIHADAFDGEGSRTVRNDDFRQLAAMIAAAFTTMA